MAVKVILLGISLTMVNGKNNKYIAITMERSGSDVRLGTSGSRQFGPDPRTAPRIWKKKLFDAGRIHVGATLMQDQICGPTIAISYKTDLGVKRLEKIVPNARRK